MTINKQGLTYKAVRGAFYAGISVFVAHLITSVQSNPTEFGAITALVNAGLVIIKDYVDSLSA